MRSAGFAAVTANEGRGAKSTGAASAANLLWWCRSAGCPGGACAAPGTSSSRLLWLALARPARWKADAFTYMSRTYACMPATQATAARPFPATSQVLSCQAAMPAPAHRLAALVLASLLLAACGPCLAAKDPCTDSEYLCMVVLPAQHPQPQPTVHAWAAISPRRRKADRQVRCSPMPACLPACPPARLPAHPRACLPAACDASRLPDPREPGSADTATGVAEILELGAGAIDIILEEGGLIGNAFRILGGLGMGIFNGGPAHHHAACQPACRSAHLYAQTPALSASPAISGPCCLAPVQTTDI